MPDHHSFNKKCRECSSEHKYTLSGNGHCQAWSNQPIPNRYDVYAVVDIIIVCFACHIWCQPIDCSLVSDAGHHQTWYVGSPRDNVRQRLVFSTCTYVTVRQCAVCRRHHSGLVLGKNNWAETKCQETSKPSGRKNGRDGRSMLIKATWYIMPKWLD